MTILLVLVVRLQQVQQHQQRYPIVSLLLLLLLLSSLCNITGYPKKYVVVNAATLTNTNTIQGKQIGIDVQGQPVIIPLVGVGTWQYNDTIAYESVCKSFQLGLTFVDTAFGYGNQYGIGQAIQDCFFYNTNNYYNHNNINNNNNNTVDSTDAFITVTNKQRRIQKRSSSRSRDDLFVLTKVPGGLSIDETLAAHEHNLKLLQLDYVDHLMIHFPSDWDVTPSKANKYVRQDQWRALEELYYTNKARSIGVSHYCTHHINDILEIATVPISINQVEYHVGSQDVDTVIETCRINNITFMSFSPLCGPCANVTPDNNLINGTSIMQIATKYNVTGSQVSLRFIIQQALVPNNPIGPVIPKSNNIDHIRTNMDLFSFVLSDDDMKTLQQTFSPPAEDGDCDVP